MPIKNLIYKALPVTDPSMYNEEGQRNLIKGPSYSTDL